MGETVPKMVAHAPSREALARDVVRFCPMLQNAEWKRAAEKKSRMVIEEESASKNFADRRHIGTVTVYEPEAFGVFPPRMRLRVNVVYENGSEENFYYFPDTRQLWPVIG